MDCNHVCTIIGENKRLKCICMKCKTCGSISVIATKDLWKLGQCPRCESKDLVNLDDEFDLSEIEEYENTKL